MNDGASSNNSGSATRQITSPASNNPPVVTTSGGSLTFTEGDAATAIDPGVSVTDPDSPNLVSATVQITTGCTNGQDVLAFVNTGSITGNYTAATCLLSLTGTDTPANYQVALRTVTYFNGSDAPNTVARVVTFSASDGGASGSGTRGITVVAVNDPPTINAPASLSTNEDTPLNITNISVADVDAGSANEQVTLGVVHGTLTINTTAGLTVVGNSSASVTMTGTIASLNGGLNGMTYTPALNFNNTRGNEVLSVGISDLGNTGTGGALTATATVPISVAPVNDPPVAAPQSYTAQANMELSTAAASGLLNGATDPDTGDGGYTAVFTVGTVNGVLPTAGAITTTIAGVGTVTVADVTTGAFEFDPAPGVTGAVSFNYTVCDSGNPAPPACSAAATVGFSINSPVIWFVNSAAVTNGDGRLSSPFNNLASAATAIGANTSQRIFLYAGSYTTGRTLNTGEWLIGQGVTNAPTNTFDALMAISPPAGTLARPAIGTGTATVQSTVTLNTNAVVRGLAVASTTSTGVNDPTGSISGVTVDQVSLTTTTGTALSLSNVTASGLTFTGVTTSGGAGVALSGTNTSTTFTFSGISISSGANAGFSTTGGGTVNATGSTNAITSTTGTALTVTNTTIGGSDLNFQKITSTGSVNGIVLTNTGSTGGLTVTGTGGSCSTAANCTGGAIQSTTGAGISLTTTRDTSLNDMFIGSTAASGVDGQGITNFTFTNGTIVNAGTAGTAGTFQSAIAFNGSLSGTGNNITGTLTVTGNTFTNPHYSGLDVQSNAGNVFNVNVSNNTITTPGFSGINFVGGGSSSAVFSVTNAVINQNNISGTGGNGIQVSLSNTSTLGPGPTGGVAGSPIAITNNSITSIGAAGTQAITYALQGERSVQRAQGNFVIQCNGKNTSPCSAPTASPLGSSSIGTVILIGNNDLATATGVIDNNAIVSTQTPNGGGGNGIGGGNGSPGGTGSTPNLTLSVTNNSITGTDGNGILLVGRGGTGTANFKVANNNVGAAVNAGGTAREGIRVDAGNAVSVDDSVCLNMSGNTSAGSNGAAGLGVRKQGTNPTINDFGLQGIPQNPPSNQDVTDYVTAQNPNGNGLDIISGSGFIQCSSAPT